MKKWIAIIALFFIGFGANAQYYDYNGPDRYFYEDDFDWRWDVRVRISDGLRSGYLTNSEANRLYRYLENIERKEWAFQSDGYYSVYEQDEIWMDIRDLHHLIGLELTDWDRRYYGYSGVVITGRLPWYFGPTYDFYRFDKRGFGSIHIGYIPRNYVPHKHVYYSNRNNYTLNWKTRPSVVIPKEPRRVVATRPNEPARGRESSRVMDNSRVSPRDMGGRQSNSNARVQAPAPSNGGSRVDRAPSAPSPRIDRAPSSSSSRQGRVSAPSGNNNRSEGHSSGRRGRD